MAAPVIGIFLGIFFLFINIDTAVRIAAAVLVGIVGVLSFIRHSLHYESDQVRMGWRQDHPEFQIEAGSANLALGIWALVAAASSWGLACGLVLATYMTYLLCALLLHLSQAHAPEGLHDPALRARAIRSTISTGFFRAGTLRFLRAGICTSGRAAVYAPITGITIRKLPLQQRGVEYQNPSDVRFVSVGLPPVVPVFMCLPFLSPSHAALIMADRPVFNIMQEYYIPFLQSSVRFLSPILNLPCMQMNTSSDSGCQINVRFVFTRLK
jgi:hypothetical protein